MDKHARLKVLLLVASASLLALIATNVVWLWLNPTLLAVGKIVLLFLPLPGVLRGRRYTCQWATMLLLLFVIDGIVQTFGDSGIASRLARIEAFLAILFIGAAMFFAKFSATGRQQK
jgi:uncharacterized membrane protein